MYAQHSVFAFAWKFLHRYIEHTYVGEFLLQIWEETSDLSDKELYVKQSIILLQVSCKPMKSELWNGDWGDGGGETATHA